MNLILLLVIGFLVFIGTYMILSLNLIRIVIGISIYTHAGNLIIMSMGHYSNKMTEPLIHGSNTNYVDPLLQAIVLTAIVIGFAMTAFLLVLVYRTYRVTKEANIDVLRGEEDENEQEFISPSNPITIVMCISPCFY